MSHNILLVDDDHELSELLSTYLKGEGFEIVQIFDGLEAINHLQEKHQVNDEYDAIILDFMLPGMQGLDILQRLRSFSKIPVIMLTARGDDIDRIVGLESGADDYLAKPCNPRELLARLRAILRRSDQPAQETELSSSPNILSIHNISLDLGNRTSFVGDQALELTSAEFNTLAALMKNPGEIISKEQLTELALNKKFTRYDRSIDVHISSVRKKISQFIKDKDVIKTVRGSGYILITQLDA